jgi:glycosyltransferase involved in cell wall biosynthesis
VKVTYVVNALGEGGTERSLADLLPGLRDGGVEVGIVTIRSRGDEGVEPLLRAQGFEIHTIGSIGRLRTLRALRRLLRTQRPDIVHTMLFEANLYGRLATIGTGARLVVSLVNTTYSDARLDDPRLNRRKVRAVQALDTVLGRLRTDRFHAVSRTVKDDAVAALRLPEDKVTVIERGRRPETLPVTSPDRRAAARTQLDLAHHAEVLVAVGRQEYQKGHRYLLQAVHQLADRADLMLLVAGRTGNESAELQQILAGMPETAKRVRLLGHRSDVAEILAAGDLFVFASLFEGMPGAVIEAMASGLPIVASDIEPVREVVDIDGNAILVPPRDASAFAVAVRRLLDDRPRLDLMGHRSREIFEDRFTIEHSVQGFLDLYHQVAPAKSHRA